MFDVLKKKLSKAIESISKRVIEKGEQDIKEDSKKLKGSSEAIEYQQVSTEIVSENLSEKLKIDEIRALDTGEVSKDLKIESESKNTGKPRKMPFIKEAFEKVSKKITEKTLEKKDLYPVLEELERDLIDADVAVDVAEKIKIQLVETLSGKHIKRGNEKKLIINAFKETILNIVSVPELNLKDMASKKRPVVLLFLGFNGAGKTTSIAKVANWIKKNGMTSVLAAADTFRAASIEQLEEHADNLGVRVIKHSYGSDPAAVVYDAIEHAKAKGVDFVLADSAGRIHTNENLMKELKKIAKVSKPDLKILVIDSLTGNDALLQAKAFGEIGIDAVIFTKVDVNEKGGSILSVTNELNKPILFLSMGQGYDEFENFDAEKFVRNLFE